jgi:hypothetical protein
MEKTKMLKNAIDFAEYSLGEVDDISIFDGFKSVYINGVTADGDKFTVHIRVDEKENNND